MKHFATPDFWACYRRLPAETRAIADRSFALLKADPRHPSLRFKKLGAVWSARVGLRYRALATEVESGFVWFWIGSHAEYDALVERKA